MYSNICHFCKVWCQVWWSFIKKFLVTGGERYCRGIIILLVYLNTFAEEIYKLIPTDHYNFFAMLQKQHVVVHLAKYHKKLHHQWRNICGGCSAGLANWTFKENVWRKNFVIFLEAMCLQCFALQDCKNHVWFCMSVTDPARLSCIKARFEHIGYFEPLMPNSHDLWWSWYNTRKHVFGISECKWQCKGTVVL